MRSPFAIFRKHQKVLMVVLIGLAMFAFIFMDQLSRSSNPTAALAWLLPLLGAGAFWIIGTQTGKPIEYVIAGAILGTIGGFATTRIGGPASAVETNIGNLSPSELDDLVKRRQIANNFVTAAYEKGNPLPASDSDPHNRRIQQLMIQFWKQGLQRVQFSINARQPIEKDVMLGYLLRHEAKRMQIEVSDQAVTDFITKLLAQTLKKQQFREIRAQFRLGESELYNILRDELLAKEALQLLLPRNPQTPDQYWQHYRKINIRQLLQATAVPVAAFSTAVEKPSDTQLLEFFTAQKKYVPNELGPGEPGFRQLRKVRLAYLEVDYLRTEEEIAPKTDDDIQKFDEEILAFFQDNKDALYKIRTLPNQTTNDEVEPIQPEFEPEAKLEPEKNVSDANDPVPKESDPKKADSATNKSGDKNDTAASGPKYRPLNDDLKSEIRDILLRERTLEEMKSRIETVLAEMQEIGYRANSLENDPDRMTTAQVESNVRSLAKRIGSRYIRTPLLSAQELADSEEHVLGHATEPVENPLERASAQRVLDRIFGSESGQYYSAEEAEDFVTNNRFVYWTIDDREAHVPTFEEPGIRAQVLKAWKTEQGRPKAKERAKELADLVQIASKNGTSMSEELADQTLTRKPDGIRLTVLNTPEFSWYSQTTPSGPSLSFLQQQSGPPAQLSHIPGIENVGNEFMDIVFNQLSNGDVGVAVNRNRSVYYVVKVMNRSHLDESNDLALKQKFFKKRSFLTGPYRYLADLDRVEAYLNWIDQFAESYAVVWKQPTPRL